MAIISGDLAEPFAFVPLVVDFSVEQAQSDNYCIW